MFLAEQPRRAPAEKTSTYLLGFLGRVGIGHEISHKKQIVCHALAASSPMLGLPRAKQAQYRTRKRNNPPAGATSRLEVIRPFFFARRCRISALELLP